MPKVKIESASFDLMLESLRSIQEDCADEDVEKIPSLVLTLFDQELNFVKLKEVQSTLNAKVSIISPEVEHSNLEALAKRVNDVVQKIQKKQR